MPACERDGKRGSSLLGRGREKAMVELFRQTLLGPRWPFPAMGNTFFRVAGKSGAPLRKSADKAQVRLVKARKPHILFVSDAFDRGRLSPCQPNSYGIFAKNLSYRPKLGDEACAISELGIPGSFFFVSPMRTWRAILGIEYIQAFFALAVVIQPKTMPCRVYRLFEIALCSGATT